ncbi:hypothetical protein MGAST_17595 [Mycobacterium gastri 'Wayne']|nr:hypothetical protein MGAST_17595 [Mycobacterium gastri 'Wayne']
MLKPWWPRALVSAVGYAMALAADWLVRGLVVGRFEPWLLTPVHAARAS